MRPFRNDSCKWSKLGSRHLLQYAVFSRTLAEISMQLRESYRQGGYIVALSLVQLLLSYAALGPIELPQHTAVRIAIGDCQIALAMVLAAWSTLRLSLRVPIVVALVVSGWEAHYVCWIETRYPYVAGEQYLMSLFVGLTIFVMLRLLRCSLRYAEPRERSWTQFTLQDMLVWGAVIGILITVVKRAKALTDVGGMYDPWETLGFIAIAMPEFILPRLPLLAANLLLHGVTWSALSWIALSGAQWRWWSAAWALLIFVIFAWFEILVATGAQLFTEPVSSPILPVSTVVSLDMLRKLSWGSDGRFWEIIAEPVVLVTSRVTIYASSLLLLRGAGLRLRPALEPWNVANSEAEERD
jgi:hypothetical protein